MQHVLPFLIGPLMLATAGVLIAGVVGLVRGSQDPRRSNQLMRWRIILQAAALTLFVLMLALARR